MPRFSANLGLMFKEHGFLDRFAAASAAGFEAVEFLFPYDFPAAEVARRLDDHDLAISVFNSWPGDWAAGDRGLATDPARVADFSRSIDMAIDYAGTIGADRIHCIAGMLAPDANAEVRKRAWDTLSENFARAAARFKAAGILLLVEPVSPATAAGYILRDFGEAAALVRELGTDRARLQYDLFHAGVMGEDQPSLLRELMPIIGHVQLADAPGRGQPGSGSIDFSELLPLLDALGYDGWVGCEYVPTTSQTEASLGWLSAYR